MSLGRDRWIGPSTRGFSPPFTRDRWTLRPNWADDSPLIGGFPIAPGAGGLGSGASAPLTPLSAPQAVVGPQQSPAKARPRISRASRHGRFPASPGPAIEIDAAGCKPSDLRRHGVADRQDDRRPRGRFRARQNPAAMRLGASIARVRHGRRIGRLAVSISSLSRLRRTSPSPCTRPNPANWGRNPPNPAESAQSG